MILTKYGEKETERTVFGLKHRNDHVLETSASALIGY
jgi:hypothetical protein